MIEDGESGAARLTTRGVRPDDEGEPLELDPEVMDDPDEYPAYYSQVFI